MPLVRQDRLKKKKGKIILLCVLFCLFILAMIIITFFKKRDIHLIHGTITTQFENTEYNDRTFLINTDSGPYMDSFITLEEASSRFHRDFQPGDSVYVFCSIYPKEIAPTIIDIFLLLNVKK